MIQMHAAGALRVIPNFAFQHLRAARLFRDQAVALEAIHAAESLGAFYEDLRSYVSGCVMSSAAALEALVNELFIAPNCGLRPKLTNFENEFWGKNGIERKPILDKYQLALTMLGYQGFDSSNVSYCDAGALVEFRNALVHFKPSWDPRRQREIDLVTLLTGKYGLSPFVDAGADFVTMKSMSGSCATWVITTVVNFLSEFDHLTRLDDKKMSAFKQLAI